MVHEINTSSTSNENVVNSTSLEDVAVSEVRYEKYKLPQLSYGNFNVLL